MIVTLESVKAILGIDADDDSNDAHLTSLILAATEFVQRETHVYFGTPSSKEEFVRGTGRTELYLRGHIDESAEVGGDDSADTDTRIVVSRRLWAEVGGTWEELVEGTDYERRGDVLIAAGLFGGGWDRCFEFRLVYADGYVTAPEDIQALIRDMVARQFTADADLAAGTTGITSEHIGDYAYTVDLSATVAISGDIVSTTGWHTINHYKRLLV